MLGDVNEDLIQFYKALKHFPHKLCREILAMPPTQRSYYRIRGMVPSGSIASAARFYYLIRLAWNALYRVNKRGEFNVPFGGRRPKQLLKVPVALQAARKLRSAKLVSGDFASTSASARRGDFVYFDPPYPKGSLNGNGFARYHEIGFTLDDHTRLARHAQKLARRGVNVMVTLAARRNLLTLYPSFDVHLFRSKSLIAADGASRRNAYEAVLLSYPLSKTVKFSKVR